MKPNIKLFVATFLLLILCLSTINSQQRQKKRSQNSQNTLSAVFLQRWSKANCNSAPNGEFYKLSEIQCPEGYSIPTKADFEKLMKYPHRWSTSNNPNNINGIWFGMTEEAVNNATESNDCECLFFPALGSYYGNANGKKNSCGISARGMYWSCSKFDGDRTWAMAFNADILEMIGAWSYAKGYCWDELPVRCIKK